MTNNGGILRSLHLYHGNMYITIGNGDTLDITHTTDTSLALSSGSVLPIKDVLVAPNIQKNLLSISQLTIDYTCTCEFFL